MKIAWLHMLIIKWLAKCGVPGFNNNWGNT
jgi:hypothetical protein